MWGYQMIIFKTRLEIEMPKALREKGSHPPQLTRRSGITELPQLSPGRALAENNFGAFCTGYLKNCLW